MNWASIAVALLAWVGPDEIRPAEGKALADDLIGRIRNHSLGAWDVRRGDHPTLQSPEALRLAIPGLLALLDDRDPACRLAGLAALGRLKEDADAIVPALIRLLGDGRPEVRAVAAFGLGNFPGSARDVVPPLVRASADDHPRVRAASVRALGSFPVGDLAGAWPALIGRLGDPDVEVRRQAVDALAGPEPVEAAPIDGLAARLADPDRTVRSRAIWALKKKGPMAAAAVPALLGRLGDCSGENRLDAIRAIGEIAPTDPSLVAPLRAAYRRADGIAATYSFDGISDIREDALKLLASSGGFVPEVEAALVLESDERELPGLMAVALVRNGRSLSRSARTLAGTWRFADGCSLSSQEVVRTLESIGPAAIPALIDSLSGSGQALVRQRSARILGRSGIGGRPAVASLVQSLADARLAPRTFSNSRNVEGTAEQALLQLGPVAVPGLTRALGRDGGLDLSGRVASARILGMMGADATPAIPGLIAALDDPAIELRTEAIEALGRLGRSALAAADPLRRLAKLDDGEVSAKAARSLDRIGSDAPPFLGPLADLREAVGRVIEASLQSGLRDFRNAGSILITIHERLEAIRSGRDARSALPWLLESLGFSLPLYDSEVESVREPARRALLAIGPEAAVPALVVALDGDESLRIEACGLLARFGPGASGAIDALVRAGLRDPSPEVRDAAAMALGRSGTRAVPRLLGMVDGPSAPARRLALRCLVLMDVPAPEALPALRRIASADGDLGIRVEAIQALGQHARAGDPGLSDLRGLLASDDDTLRESAGTALCRLPLEIGIPLLIEALGRPEPRARQAAAMALGFLGPDAAGALPALTRLLGDPAPEVQDRAGRAIVAIQPPDPGRDLAQIQDELNRPDAVGPVRALAQLARRLDFQAIRSAFPMGSSSVLDGETTRLLGRFDRAGLAGKEIGRDAETVDRFVREAEAILPTLADLAFEHRSRPARVSALGVIGGMGPLATAALPRLVGAMGDPDPSVRQAAAQAVAKIGGDPDVVVPAIGPALAHPHADSRLRAARMIADQAEWVREATARGVIPALGAGLADPDPRIRGYLLVALGIFGPAARPAVPAIVRTLDDPDPEIRMRAAWAIARIGTGIEAEAIDRLRAALADPDPRVRWNAADALGRAGGAARVAVDDLARALEAPEDQVRWKAAEALGLLGRDATRAIPALVAALDREDDAGRVNLARALWRVERRASRVLPILIEIVGDDSGSARPIESGAGYRTDEFEYRKVACWTLALIGPEARSAVPALVAGLDLGPRADQAACAEALGEIGPGAIDAVPALARVVVNHAWDEDAALDAGQALAAIGPPAAAAVPELARVLGEPSAPGNLRVQAANAMRRIGVRDVPGATALASALSDRSDWVRHHAAAAIVEAGPAAGPTEARVRGLLADDRAEVRPYAAVALLGIRPGDPEALRVLAAGLKSPDGDLRAQSAVASASLGPAGGPAVPVLIEALDDPLPIVREWVADALGRIGLSPREVVPTLTRALGDKNPGVRLYAAEALGRFGKSAGPAEAGLVALLKDPIPGIRVQASLALSRIAANPAGVPVLIEVLQAEDPFGAIEAAKQKGTRKERSDATDEAFRSRSQLRKAAIEALATIGEPARPAIPALETFLRADLSLVVPRTAARALRAIDPPAHPEDR